MPARWTATTTTTLGDAGAAWAQSTMAAVSVTLSPGNTFMHPLGRFELSVSFGGTGSLTLAGAGFDMYFRYGNSAAYAGTPSISYFNTYVGTFNIIPGAQGTAQQHMVIEDVPLPKSHAIVYLFNRSQQAVSTSWALVMVPWSLTAT